MQECVVSSSKNFAPFESGADLLDKGLEVGVADYEQEDEELITHALDWKKHLTLRAILVGAILGVLGGIIMLQISLLSPITPSLNVVFSIFSYSIIRMIVNIGCTKLQFTKQENTIAQTLAMTASAGGQSCGYSTWYAAMMPVYGEADGLTLATVDTLNFGRLIGSSFSVLFPGIFLLTFLSKFFATNEKLPFPSGTAAGVTLAAFHEGSKETAALVKKQLVSFGKWFSMSFVWTTLSSIFGVPLNSSCGGPLPIFGTSIASKFYGWGNWDYNIIFIGVGLMLPVDFVWSVIYGMVINCFAFKPWIAEHGIDIQYPSLTGVWNATAQQEADSMNAWYSTSDTMLDGHDTPAMRSAYAYRVFAFALILLGEGFFCNWTVHGCSLQCTLQEQNAER
mmetsp:Transcript_15715/g.33963  ORF Transcript_15715/g.33963 Transcript_15715/m.33963 type:complete len:394 (-) Transcript_15715:3749-4930(-)